MATLQANVLPGEVLSLYAAAKVEWNVQARQKPYQAPLTTATADTAGRAQFTAQPTRIEFVAFRADGTPIRLMDSITRKAS